MFIVTCSDENKHLCVDAFKRSRIVHTFVVTCSDNSNSQSFAAAVFFFRFKFMHLNLTKMLNPDDAPEGWRLIENTSIYLDDRDTFAFMATHSKACGIAGLVRHPLVDITTN
jgi:hypothetical protein